MAASKASVIAMDQTMAEAVTIAKTLAPVRTGILQGSIRYVPARVVGETVHGQWGSFSVNYAIFQELGTSRMRARPYLRPAAERAYQGLPARLKAAMK